MKAPFFKLIWFNYKSKVTKKPQIRQGLGLSYIFISKLGLAAIIGTLLKPDCTLF